MVRMESHGLWPRLARAFGALRSRTRADGNHRFQDPIGKGVCRMKAAILACIAILPLMGEINPLFAKRRPLPRPELDKIEHQPTGRSLRADPKTGEPLVYDVEGAITYDRRSGNFLLRWTGRRGKRLTVVYEPRLKVDAIVSAAVIYDSGGNAYRYLYSLRSLPSSQQKLQSFYVETRAPVEKVTSPDLSWHAFHLTDHQKQHLQIAGGRQWSQTRQGQVGLLPGTDASGFSYESAGLPGPVKCYAEGRTSLQDVGEVIPEELIVAFGKADWIIPQGFTVGPEIPAQPFRAGPFLQKIAGYISVSVEQGWIESTQVAEEIRKSLEQLHDAVERRDRRQSDSILRDLMARVESEKDKALLSEAYALLKFNLEYLQQRLRVD
jgi:hypothetical protein